MTSVAERGAMCSSAASSEERMPPSWAVSIRIVRIWEGVTSQAERDAIEAARRRRATAPNCSPRPSDVGSSFMGAE